MTEDEFKEAVRKIAEQSGMSDEELSEACASLTIEFDMRAAGEDEG